MVLRETLQQTLGDAPRTHARRLRATSDASALMQRRSALLKLSMFGCGEEFRNTPETLFARYRIGGFLSDIRVARSMRDLRERLLNLLPPGPRLVCRRPPSQLLGAVQHHQPAHSIFLFLATLHDDSERVDLLDAS